MPVSQVAVVITTRNEEGNIEDCLRSVKSQSFPSDRIEIIVVDNRSEDRTKVIASKYTDRIFDCGPERSAQRNFGVKQAGGEFILYLDADMRLSQNLISECVKKCSDERLVALYVPEEIVGNGFWTKVRNFERGFYNSTVVDCVRFVRKDVFLELGGFDESLTGPEDWDFDRRVRAMGAVGITQAHLNHDEGAFDISKYVRKKLYYSGSFKDYLAKWGKEDPVIKKQLGVKYRYFDVFIEDGKWKRFISHPVLAVSMYLWRVFFGLLYLLNK